MTFGLFLEQVTPVSYTHLDVYKRQAPVAPSLDTPRQPRLSELLSCVPYYFNMTIFQLILTVFTNVNRRSSVI